MSDDKASIQPAPSNPAGENNAALSELAGVLNVPGPQIPDEATINSLVAALSPEELKKRQEELNKGN